MTLPCKRVRANGGKLAFAIAAALLFCCTTAFAQESSCKIKGGVVKPDYPEVARRMKITGAVRLQLLITAGGTVRESKVLGGNPVLASAAQDAAKRSRFENAEACVIVYEFKP